MADRVISAAANNTIHAREEVVPLCHLLSADKSLSHIVAIPNHISAFLHLHHQPFA